MANLRTSLALLAALSLIPAAAAAQQQPQSPSTQKEKDKPKPKAKRVWGQDDVKELRKPVDDYTDQKQATADAEAKVAAEKAEAEKSGKPVAATAAAPSGSSAATGEEDLLPKTPQEVDKRIADKLEEIKFQQEKVAELRRQLYATSVESERETLRNLVDKGILGLQEANEELAALLKRQEALKAKKESAPADAGETKPPAPQTPPPTS